MVGKDVSRMVAVVGRIKIGVKRDNVGRVRRSGQSEARLHKHTKVRKGGGSKVSVIYTPPQVLASPCGLCRVLASWHGLCGVQASLHRLCTKIALSKD